jgi:hypothetical protein
MMLLNVASELIAKRVALLRLKQNLVDQNIALKISAGRYGRSDPEGLYTEGGR